MNARKVETVEPREAVSSNIRARAPEPVCGDYGGENSDGDPCGRNAGWGRPGVDTGRCRDHVVDEAGPEPEQPTDPDASAAAAAEKTTVEEVTHA